MVDIMKCIGINEYKIASIARNQRLTDYFKYEYRKQTVLCIINL